MQCYQITLSEKIMIAVTMSFNYSFVQMIWYQGCGIGIGVRVGVARSRKFLGRVGFLRTLGAGVGVGHFTSDSATLFGIQV